MRFEEIAFLAEYLKDADHVDVKSTEGTLSLREFVVGVFTYKPVWMQYLWTMRTKLVGVLGIETDTEPVEGGLPLETLPIKPGETALFLTVRDSDGETFWVADKRDTHLDFAVGVLADPNHNEEGLRRYQIMTIVKYHNRIGRLYFNIIRPFHHFVVAASMRGALRNLG